jgi:hypothetical protein
LGVVLFALALALDALLPSPLPSDYAADRVCTMTAAASARGPACAASAVRVAAASMSGGRFDDVQLRLAFAAGGHADVRLSGPREVPAALAASSRDVFAVTYRRTVVAVVTRAQRWETLDAPREHRVVTDFMLVGGMVAVALGIVGVALNALVLRAAARPRRPRGR